MDDAIVHKGSRTNLLGKREQDIALRNLFSLEKQVDGNTAPAILFHASNDKAVSPLNSIAYYTALYKSGNREIFVASVSCRRACHLFCVHKGEARSCGRSWLKLG